jgi:hypothetical protein
MSGSAGFHTDQASRNLAQEIDDLLAPQLTGDDDLARIIHAVHLEHVLGEINADGANLHMDDPSGDSLFNDPLWHIRCRERASSTTSKAAVAAGSPEVCLPPDSGGMADIPQPLLGAITGSRHFAR